MAHVDITQACSLFFIWITLIVKNSRRKFESFCNFSPRHNIDKMFLISCETDVYTHQHCSYLIHLLTQACIKSLDATLSQFYLITFKTLKIYCVYLIHSYISHIFLDVIYTLSKGAGMLFSLNISCSLFYQ